MNVRFILGGLTIASAAAITFTGCNKSNDDAVSTTVGEEIAEELFTQPLQSVKDPSMVLAVVNGTEITQGQINTEVERMLQRMQGRVPPERVEQMRAQMETQMLDNLVNRQVLLDKVASENITISDEEFDTAVGELTANLPPGASLDDMLAQTGTSQDEFRDNFGMELKIRKLIEASSGGTIEATEEEALAFYEENKQQFEKPESATASPILPNWPANTLPAPARRRAATSVNSPAAAWFPNSNKPPSANPSAKSAKSWKPSSASTS
jgi:FKBP-type peptidyl-prolyl cis-trans isomerase (trigger factor)